MARRTFDLARIYRDQGRTELAIDAYQRRAGLGFDRQEIYRSLVDAGRLQEQLGLPFETVLATYKRAISAWPTRAEAYHGASRLCRLHGQNARGYAFAKLALDLDPAPDDLDQESWISDYGLLDEYAVNAYWAGRDRDCLDASLRMLAQPATPPLEHPRIMQNMRFALDRLRDKAPASLLETEAPRVLVAILAKQKEPVLPLYLQCIEALDYPKSSIALYIRTNNNTDRTADILRDWTTRVAPLYAVVDIDETPSDEPVEMFGVHEWNATRFSVLASIRNASLRKTIDHECAFYFVVDVDNFIDASTLRDLVRLDLPIVAPMLRHVDPTSFYSNFHAAIDRDGYFVDAPLYHELLSRETIGPVAVPVVHCTYLIRADQLARLRYDDATDRHEYVVFSDVARARNIPQYLDNRRDYGFLTLDDHKPDLIAGQLETIARALGMAPDRDLAGAEDQARRAFEAIYDQNVWTYGSGPGSLGFNTIEYRGFLERFIEANRIETVTDLGCGDWQSSQLIDWSGVTYTGFDVVEAVVTANRARHARSNLTFEVLRTIDDLPGGDLLVCKEVLQHLPDAMIVKYVDAIRDKYRFALFTNSTEPADLANQPIDAGGYRPLRLDEPPFSIRGAKIFTYFPQGGSYLWKNVVFLVMGSADTGPAVAPGRP